LILTFNSTVSATAGWSVEFPNFRYATVSAVVQSNSGGFLISAIEDSRDYFSGDISSSKFTLTKINNVGEIEWEQDFEQDILADTFVQTTDGGYLLGGTIPGPMIREEWVGGRQIRYYDPDRVFVVKYGPLREQQWSRTYNISPNGDRLVKIVSSNDGGYILLGYERVVDSDTGSLASAYDSNGYWLANINSMGDLQWHKVIDNSPNKKLVYDTTYDVFVACRLIQTNDGGYAIASGDRITKTDDSGNVQWFKEDFGSEFKVLLQTSDGGYIAQFLENLIKIDSAGNVEWKRSFDETNKHVASVLPTVDGGYMLCGSVSDDSFPPNAWGFLINTNSSGDPQWTRTYNSSKYSYFGYITTSNDGGYLLCGEAASALWVVETDPNGNSLCEVLTPYSSILPTPQTGSNSGENPTSWIGPVAIVSGVIMVVTMSIFVLRRKIKKPFFYSSVKRTEATKLFQILLPY
jgi:hypothetical protein